MVLTEIKGNLITMAKEGHFDAIVHGANCFHTMGAGFALHVRKEFPEAYMADKKTPFGDKLKLGTCSSGLSPIGGDAEIAVINAYTQYKPGPNVDYDAIRKCFEFLDGASHIKAKIGIPLIGCGIAGGDWTVVRDIITKAAPNLDITVVHYAG